MTDEQLDEARAKAAWEATSADKLTRFECLNANVQEAFILAARLAREGWTPAPDPDVLLARRVIASRPCKPETRDMVLAGDLDDGEAMQIALDAIRAARRDQRA